ncbi:hypothetical protein KIPE111705_14940 [Kibdelosporangium persicum]|uniref:Uncharacterized protein n=1 Tax=Kibdelosporangium persicum TaxID=2698649 RepID=A0ABX2FF28_9PSEU|nr:hypothetical protein [Kibdelosporangium persicum]NRN69485.1 hypothetical protein [Kibdelosporangium persicum]
MRRQVICLDVRVDTGETQEQVATRVGRALNCTFTEVEQPKNRYPHVATVFGLRLRLIGALGIGRKEVCKLVGHVTDEGFRTPGKGLSEHDQVDISAYVVDLLTMRTGLRWYQPTAEDRAAENKWAAAYDDWLGGVDDQRRIQDLYE